MKKCVFLDRDGVICKEKGYIKSIEELELFDYAKEAVDIFKSLGFVVVVISNQSAVARGFLSEIELNEIHDYIKLATRVDAIYYCPHLPPQQTKIQNPYVMECKCRKPQIGLIEKANRDFQLNLSLDASALKSTRDENAKEENIESIPAYFFVGDRASDIYTGEACGVKTVLLESEYGIERLEQAVQPDYRFNNLLEFAKWLEKEHEQNSNKTRIYRNTRETAARKKTSSTLPWSL